MPLTVAGLERDLVTLSGPYFPLVGMDESAQGANDSLRIAIQEAVGRMEIETADALDVADADLADLTRVQVTTLRNLSWLKTLRMIAGRYVKVDQSKGSESQSLSQRWERLTWQIGELEKQLGPLAVDPDSASIPGPSHATVIRAGLCCYPPYGSNRYGLVRSGCYINGRYYP